MKNTVHNKGCSIIRRLTGVFLALVILVSGIAPLTAYAEVGEDGQEYGRDYDRNRICYYLNVSVRTITDADGWDSARIRVYGREQNGAGEEKLVYDSSDIHRSLDDDGETAGILCPTYDLFPTRIEVYTDFGGGFTIRSWEGAVKIYVNGVNVKTENIRATSGVFSSSDKTNNIIIDKSKYPYPERINVLTCHKSLSQLPDDEIFDTFYQAEGSPDCSGKAYVYAVDQYGKVWKESPSSIASISDPETDSGAIGGSDDLDEFISGRYAEFRSSSGASHKAHTN